MFLCMGLALTVWWKRSCSTETDMQCEHADLCACGGVDIRTKDNNIWRLKSLCECVDRCYLCAWLWLNFLRTGPMLSHIVYLDTYRLYHVKSCKFNAINALPLCVVCVCCECAINIRSHQLWMHRIIHRQIWHRDIHVFSKTTMNTVTNHSIFDHNTFINNDTV